MKTPKEPSDATIDYATALYILSRHICLNCRRLYNKKRTSLPGSTEGGQTSFCFKCQTALEIEAEFIKAFKVETK